MMWQMFVRRLKSILQISEDKRFAELATGLEQLGRSVIALTADADQLAQARRFQSAAVLRGFAEEEAAKVLILLDIARCGWGDDKSVSSCMRVFYQHLGRGLYVKAYDGKPADLAEVAGYIDGFRDDLYLDGPTEVDWVFRNPVLEERETALYVDYVETESGERYWTGPEARAAVFDEPYMHTAPTCNAVTLVCAMARSGLLTELGLQATRDVWGGAAIAVDSMRWQRDLVPLNKAVVDAVIDQGGVPADVGQKDRRNVVQLWIFPLSSLDLTAVKVDVKDLQQERAKYLEKEYGIGG